MKLKTRLKIAFLITVLLPILVGGLAIFGIAQYQTEVLEKDYGIKGMTYRDLIGSAQLLNALNEKNYQAVDSWLEENTSAAASGKELELESARLEGDCSYLIVRTDGEIVFNGWKQGTRTSENDLPAYGSHMATDQNGGLLDSASQSMIRQMDLNMPDGAKTSIFVVTQGSELVPQYRAMVESIAIAVVLALVITALLLFFWIYQYLVHPLDRLSKATKNIKEGNLDFTMQGMTAKDEIGELCTGFEEMRQRLAEQAEEKVRNDRENKELISNISHDLKTPITAVKGYVEGIMDGVADTPEKMDRYIRTIYNKANEMDALIDELTFYSKIDTNRIPYTFTRLNAVDYFNDCAAELELELEAKSIRLEYSNSVSETVRIIADAEQLRRVINNIVGNSIKYLGSDPGLIRLTVRDVGDYVQVDLEDNGQGIAAKDLPHIFDRFYRSDASRNSSKGGSGIGLSIVRKIIDDHGGKIWATSVEGKGATLSFVIRKYQEVPVSE